MWITTCEAKRSFWRTLRTVMHTGLPLVGVCVTLAATLFIEAPHTRVGIVVFGLLLIETGVWKLAHQLLPDERQFHALRIEGDQFLHLLRHLHETALALKDDDTPAHRRAFEDVQNMMHQAIARMAEVAGKTDAELAQAQEISSAWGC
jgi:hypothetical protein